jgi:hypothetical protein
VNNLANPTHTFVDEDQKLIDFCLHVIARLVQETGNDQLEVMRTAIAELDSKTRTVVERARSHRLQGEPFDVSHFDPGFAPTDPISLMDIGIRSVDDLALIGGESAANTALDTELFSSWLETQYFDVGVSLAESAHHAEKDTPDFEGVVATFLKQSWF